LVDAGEEGGLGGGGVFLLVEEVVLAGEHQEGRDGEGGPVVYHPELVAGVAPDRLDYSDGLVVLAREEAVSTEREWRGGRALQLRVIWQIIILDYW
jgi:hypothetical protein